MTDDPVADRQARGAGPGIGADGGRVTVVAKINSTRVWVCPS